MHHSLLFATAIADALIANAGLTATVFAQAGTEAAAMPQLAILVADLSPIHSKCARGTLTLRYHYDADDTPAAVAAADLQDAVEYLITLAGQAAIQTLLKPAGIWLRRLGTGGFASNSADTGERTRTLDMTTGFFIQTDI